MDLAAPARPNPGREKPSALKPGRPRRQKPDVPITVRHFVPDGAGGYTEVTDAAGRSQLAARLLCAALDLPVETGPLRPAKTAENALPETALPETACTEAGFSETALPETALPETDPERRPTCPA